MTCGDGSRRDTVLAVESAALRATWRGGHAEGAVLTGAERSAQHVMLVTVAVAEHNWCDASLVYSGSGTEGHVVGARVALLDAAIKGAGRGRS